MGKSRERRGGQDKRWEVKGKEKRSGERMGSQENGRNSRERKEGQEKRGEVKRKRESEEKGEKVKRNKDR